MGNSSSHLLAASTFGFQRRDAHFCSFRSYRRRSRELSSRASTELDRAKDVFHKFVICFDWDTVPQKRNKRGPSKATPKIRHELIKFHLVQTARSRFKDYVRRYGCTASSRRIGPSEQARMFPEEYKGRQTDIQLCSVTMTPKTREQLQASHPELFYDFESIPEMCLLSYLASFGIPLIDARGWLYTPQESEGVLQPIRDIDEFLAEKAIEYPKMVYDKSMNINNKPLKAVGSMVKRKRSGSRLNFSMPPAKRTRLSVPKIVSPSPPPVPRRQNPPRACAPRVEPKPVPKKKKMTKKRSIREVQTPTIPAEYLNLPRRRNPSRKCKAVVKETPPKVSRPKKRRKVEDYDYVP